MKTLAASVRELLPTPRGERVASGDRYRRGPSFAEGTPRYTLVYSDAWLRPPLWRLGEDARAGIVFALSSGLTQRDNDMAASKRALEGTNRVERSQSQKPATAKAPAPRKLNGSNWYRKSYPTPQKR